MLDAIVVICSAIIFILSGGQIFKNRFSNNSLLAAILGFLAAAVTLFLVKDVREIALELLNVNVKRNEFLTASEYYLRGNERMSQGKFQDALSDFDAAILIKPDYAQALLSRAKVKTELKDYISALIDAESAKKSMPSLVEVDNVKKYIESRAKLDSLSGLFEEMDSNK